MFFGFVCFDEPHICIVASQTLRVLGLTEECAPRPGGGALPRFDKMKMVSSGKPKVRASED